MDGHGEEMKFLQWHGGFVQPREQNPFRASPFPFSKQKKLLQYCKYPLHSLVGNEMGETQITTNIYEILLFIKLVLLIEHSLSY